MKVTPIYYCHFLIWIITFLVIYAGAKEVKGLYDINRNLTRVKFELKKEIANIRFGAEKPIGYPLKENHKISSFFGMRTHPITKEEIFHSGIDFPAKIGTPIFSTAAGTVVETDHNNPIYGNRVVIHHNTYITTYNHMDSIEVMTGEKVNAEEIIGSVGNTGRSTGPHLHYEVIKNNFLNPIDFLGTSLKSN